MKVSKSRVVIVTSCAAILGLGVGGGVVAFAGESDSPTSQTQGTLDGGVLTKSWETNEFGLTVGEPTEADRIAQNLPDLAPAVAENGEKGFIHAKDLYLPDPKTPEEAAAQTRARLNDKGEAWVDVYKADGKSLIGREFIAQVTMNESDAK